MSQGIKLPFVAQSDPVYEAHVSAPAPSTGGYLSDATYYVQGPGGGPFDYYGGTLYPGSRFFDAGVTRSEMCKAHAETAAALCNAAYAEGYARAQMDIRLALGL